MNYNLICKLIEKNSKVLDLGCGRGELLELLIKEKQISGLGVEINQDYVIEALSRSLSIVQGDLDKGLGEFQNKSYDYAILNQTLQSTKNPEFVVDEMLRVAKKCIVSFPNFAYWKVRFYLFFKGKMPKSDILPYEWYDTPNVHLNTISDFIEFCNSRNIKIEKSLYQPKSFMPNLLAAEAIFVISTPEEF